MSLPPRWLRRLVLAPLVVLLAVLAVVTAPVWLLITLIIAPLSRNRLRAQRVLWLVTVYLVVEAVALTAMLGLWVACGLGTRIDAPAVQRRHYRLCGAMLRVLYRQAQWALRVTVEIDGADPDQVPTGRPLLVLCRHAGLGDSFLLVHALINWYRREPRIVLKESLLWDPAIDVLLNRLPSRFIAPGAGGQAARQIGDLARDLDGDDALVIFPEGGKFTPMRWHRAIARLRRLGLAAMAGKAERMRNVLPPQPGGVLAALHANPAASVVLVGHTGVDHLRTVADVWRELPMDKTIQMRWWLESPADIPHSEPERIEWLYGWWARIDEWVEQNRVTAAA